MILVTGGTGLVGSHLLYHLAKENNKIRAIYRKNSNLKAVEHVFRYYTEDYKAVFKKIEWIEADITDVVSLEKAFENVTHVYHAAALVSFNPNDYKLMRKINIEGTSNIVNLCIAENVVKLCFVSSIATIDKSLQNEFIDENCEWNSESNNYGYAITKYGAEMEVWRATQEGVDVVIVNPGVILGAGFWLNGTGKIFHKVYKGLKYYAEGITGFVSVKDVVKSMIALMNSNIKNERYILVSENRSYKALFFEIADTFKARRPSVKITKLMGSIGWRVFAVISFFTKNPPVITRQSAKSIQSTYRYSSNKIKEALQFEFEPLSSTITEICELYKRDLK